MLLWTAALASRVQAAAVLEWQRSFGGSDIDFADVVKPTRDGGYVLGGYSYSSAASAKTSASYGGGDYWLVKLDADGHRQWDQSFGGASFDRLTALQQTADGGYLLGGCSYSGVSGNKSSGNFGSADYWVVKLDAGGNKQWEQAFGGSGLDTLTSLQQTSDGGYLLGGTSSSPASGNKSAASFSAASGDYWIVKLDANGNKQWDRTYGGTDQDELHGLQQTRDGGYILAGHSYSGVSGNKTVANFGAGTSDFWLVKLDASGARQWDKAFGGDDAEELRNVHQTADGGYILGGNSYSDISGNKTAPSHGSHDYWIVKLDSGGHQQWDQAYGGSDADDLHSVQQTADGGYILGGVSFSAISGNKAKTSAGSESGDYWTVKLDGRGAKQWEQSVPGNYSAEILPLEPTPDGAFVLAGLGTTGSANLDFAVSKLAAALHFSAFSVNASRTLQARLSAISGSDYVLQASTDLLNWTSVQTNRAALGVVTFTHSNSAGLAKRFYRVRQQP